MTSSKKQNINIVWFKRDLRIHDNQALTAAAKNLPIIPLYVFEPEYWQLPDTSMRQWQFIYGSLLELHQNLKCLGQGLLIKQGGVVDVLQALSKQYHIHKIYSHQETGNNWTFQRDIAVQNWCNQQGVEWVQYLQFAIVRGYLNRDSWDEFWQTVIRRSLIKAPQILKATIISNIEVLKAVKVKPDENLTELQWPGRYAAVSCLKSFLQQRGQFYQKEMSSPNTAYDSCSRLSTHIAYGTISLTEIFHALKKKATFTLQYARGSKT